ncbi:MAG: M13 family metallopeptidase [Gammaproteobacteria bacterium]|nr:M13 family metallopeptidase [Gammaproteobacteria bacterium]
MKRRFSLPSLCAAVLLGGFACAPLAAPAAPAAPAASPYANASGIDRGGFDATVRPQDDFFAWVNGGWIAATAIPPDRTWWGVVPELRAESEARQRAIIEEMAARRDLGPDSVARKIGDFFASLTDQSLVEGRGVAPIADTLARIDAIDSAESLAAAFGAAQLLGIDAPLAVGVVQDPGAADRYVPYIWQSGIALPDRDYYLRDDEKFRKIRAAYPGYIAKLLGLGGFGGTPEQGQAVFAIETRLAELHWPAEENRDMKKLYNMVPAAQLASLAPDFAWPRYIDAAGLGARPELMAAQLSYVKQIGAIVGEFPLAAWKDYLRYHALNSAAPWLSGEFERANFEFMQREVFGLAELAPEWKRAVRAIDALAGEAVGQVYVERYFPADHKQAMLELVGNLLEAFRAGITELEWMSPETRAKAEAKRARLATKIGYPDKWRDYAGLEIRADDPLGNLARASAFEYRYQLAKLDQPIDRAEWEMTPQTVNAYHQPFMNEIVFPAGFLQPPNFNMAADPAVNYGAIGYVIGHEIGHAFDDKGRAFDPYGKLQDWWSAADAEHFEQAAAKLVEQYNAFRPLPDMSIKGKLTLGENIADLTGITIAYRAYRASLGGKEAPVIDGLSGDQRFFIGFAQANRASMREEMLRSMLVSDPHSPARYRVLGVLRNFTPFYAAFGVKEGDGMYLPPDERVKIW